MTPDETLLHHGEFTQFTATRCANNAVYLKRYSCLAMQGSAFMVQLSPEEADALGCWFATPMSFDDMAKHLLVHAPTDDLELLLKRLARKHGYGLIPPNGPAPHDAWPPADHPVEPPMPAEDLAARLTKVNARLTGQQTDDDTIFTRAVKAWQYRHGQEIGKSAGAGATLKADLQSALHNVRMHGHAATLETTTYAPLAETLAAAGLGAWFALEDTAPPAHPVCQDTQAETVLAHCLAADKARQGVAVESEIRALLAQHYIDPHLSYPTMARVLAQCEPERWPDTTGQAVQG